MKVALNIGKVIYQTIKEDWLNWRRQEICIQAIFFPLYHTLLFQTLIFPCKNLELIEVAFNIGKLYTKQSKNIWYFGWHLVFLQDPIHFWFHGSSVAVMFCLIFLISPRALKEHGAFYICILFLYPLLGNLDWVRVWTGPTESLRFRLVSFMDSSESC